MAEEKKSKQEKKGNASNSKKKSNEKKVATKKNTPKKSVTGSKTTKSIKSKIEPKKEISVLNDKKKTKVIEIDQRKLIIGIVIVILIVSFCLICLFGSDSVSKKYSSNSSESSSNSSESKNILEQATKESGDISDDERIAPTEISVDDYIDLYNGEDLSLVLFSKESCGYCKIAVPILENIIYEYDVNMNHVDVGNLSSEDVSKLIGSNDYFSEGYGTPLLLVVGNGKIKDKIEGLTTKDLYIKFIKDNNFMG